MFFTMVALLLKEQCFPEASELCMTVRLVKSFILTMFIYFYCIMRCKGLWI